ncbi:MAG: HEAT repeat domain-containing protein [Candidatus Riflebacteria bacterium]|nr:HEAT repeat domain-containing protein [Candidatus Riflebacteria bacterium]
MPAEETDDDRLLQELSDPSPAIRRCAILLLARRRPRGLLDAVLARATTEPDPEVLETVVESLPDLCPEDRRGDLGVFLTKTVLSHAHPRVRRSGLLALSKIRCDGTVRAAAMALGDGDVLVRGAARSILGDVREQAVLDTARQLLGSIRVDEREAAVNVLSTVTSFLCVPVLVEGLQDRIVGSRCRAILERYAAAGSTEAMEVLGRPVPRSGQTAPPEAPRACGLAGAKPQEALEALDDPNPSKRITAVIKILGRGEKGRAGELIERLEKETDPLVMSVLINTVGRLGIVEAAPRLRDLLSSSDGRVRADAVESLGLLGSPEVKRALIPYLDDPNHRVRGNAVVACWSVAAPRCEEALKEMLGADDGWMRKAALFAIRQLSVPLLEERLVGKSSTAPQPGVSDPGRRTRNE